MNTFKIFSQRLHRFFSKQIFHSLFHHTPISPIGKLLVYETVSHQYDWNPLSFYMLLQCINLTIFREINRLQHLAPRAEIFSPSPTLFATHLLPLQRVNKPNATFRLYSKLHAMILHAFLRLQNGKSFPVSTNFQARRKYTLLVFATSTFVSK